jgi:hypothetical protein
LITKDGRIELSGEEESRLTITFDEWGRVSKAEWTLDEVLLKSLRYFYADLSEDSPVIVRAKTTEGEHIEETFVDGRLAPSSIEEFALYTSGAENDFIGPKRGEYLQYVRSHPQSLQRLKDLCAASHPQLVGRFIYSLLVPRKGETQADQSNALWLAQRLWNHQLGDRSPVQIKRAVHILMNIPNQPYRALLLSPGYLNNRRAFREFLNHLPEQDQQYIGHLLKNLNIRSTRSFRESLTVPGSMNRTLKMMGPLPKSDFPDEETYRQVDRERRAGLSEMGAQITRTKRADKELLKERAAESGINKPSIICSWNASEAMHAAPDFWLKMLKKSEDPLVTQDQLPFYRKALKILGDLTAVLISENSFGNEAWTGIHVNKEHVNPKKLSALKSQLKYDKNGGTLSGPWTAWFYHNEYSSNLKPTHIESFSMMEEEIKKLKEDKHITISFRKKGAHVVVAYKEDSQVLPFGYGVIPFSNAVIIRHEPESARTMRVEMREAGNAEFTVEVEGNILLSGNYEMYKDDEEGPCVASSADAPGLITIDLDGDKFYYEGSMDKMFRLAMSGELLDR